MTDTTIIDNLRARLTGPALAETLKRRGTNKFQLSKALGISYQSLYEWGRGTQRPTDANIVKVAKHLGLIKPSAARVLRLHKRMETLRAEIKRLGVVTK